MLAETTKQQSQLPVADIRSSGDVVVKQAMSSITSASWMRTSKDSTSKVISANERTSLSALIVYVAQTRHENEFKVERRLADQFNIANINCLPSNQYDNAIRYLVDSAAA